MADHLMQDSLTQTERKERINVKRIKTMSPHIQGVIKKFQD